MPIASTCLVANTSNFVYTWTIYLPTSSLWTPCLCEANLEAFVLWDSKCTPPLSCITSSLHGQTLATRIWMVVLLGTLPIHFACSTPYCDGPLCGSNPPSLTPMYYATTMAWRLFAHVSQNTSRTHCPCTPWSYAIPTTVATSPSNVLWRRLISHELVVSFDNHWASCSHKQWPSNLHQHSANIKYLAPYTPHKVCLAIFSQQVG
jgi:hypothetical protein